MFSAFIFLMLLILVGMFTLWYMDVLDMKQTIVFSGLLTLALYVFTYWADVASYIGL